jgi:TonB family protein
VGTYSSKTPGLVQPKLLGQMTFARYTDEAFRARIQGVVEVGLVIMEDGSIGRARITRSLDTKYGLDEEVMKAARSTKVRARRQCSTGSWTA